jgi:hypothetical protein
MKSIKVLFNGKPLKNIYPHATAWQVFKWKVARFTRKAVIYSFILGLIVSSFKVGSHFFGETVYAEKEKIVTVDNLGKKIDELKDGLLEDLRNCENAHYTEDDGIIIFDSNNKASIGEFQFQKDTVIHYYKTLYSQDITRKDAVLISLDTPKAKKLAGDIIFKTKNGLSNWINCDKKFGLSGQLTIIQKLEK